MKSLALAIIVGCVIAVAATNALAHAFLDHADPKVGSTIEKSPSVIKIWFTEEIEGAFSAMEVRDADGKQVDKKDSHVDDKDKTLLIAGASDLPPGTYKVHWHVVAIDTHRTEGDFTFTIKPKDAP